MEEEGTRITIVGLVLIVAAVIAVVLVVRALNNNEDRGPQQDQSL